MAEAIIERMLQTSNRVLLALSLLALHTHAADRQPTEVLAAAAHAPVPELGRLALSECLLELAVPMSCEPSAEEWARTTTTTSTTSTTLPKSVIAERLPRERAHRGSTIYAFQPAFWDALATCESKKQQVDDDPNDSFHSFFQWQVTPEWNTWLKAGGTGMPEEHPYEVQLELAKHWAAITDPRTQWPRCWSRALRANG
jgi:hypothetical protein